MSILHITQGFVCSLHIYSGLPLFSMVKFPSICRPYSLLFIAQSPGTSQHSHAALPAVLMDLMVLVSGDSDGDRLRWAQHLQRFSGMPAVKGE